MQIKQAKNQAEDYYTNKFIGKRQNAQKIKRNQRTKDILNFNNSSVEKQSHLMQKIKQLQKMAKQSKNKQPTVGLSNLSKLTILKAQKNSIPIKVSNYSSQKYLPPGDLLTQDQVNRKFFHLIELKVSNEAKNSEKNINIPSNFIINKQKAQKKLEQDLMYSNRLHHIARQILSQSRKKISQFQTQKQSHIRQIKLTKSTILKSQKPYLENRSIEQIIKLCDDSKTKIKTKFSKS